MLRLIFTISSHCCGTRKVASRVGIDKFKFNAECCFTQKVLTNDNARLAEVVLLLAISSELEVTKMPRKYLEYRISRVISEVNIECYTTTNEVLSRSGILVNNFVGTVYGTQSCHSYRT